MILQPSFEHLLPWMWKGIFVDLVVRAEEE